jgi:ABC-type multidrug transport system fused ATPase/permease subunit
MLKKVGRPLRKIEGGKYANVIVSVGDKFHNRKEGQDKNMIKECKRLRIPNDSKFQQIPDTTTERQIVYITGPSGSGKSTFIKLIFGIEIPISGTILIGGNDISKFSVKQLRKYRAISKN